MIELRNTGMYLREIGVLYGITYERVRQIIGNTGSDFLSRRTDLMLSKLEGDQFSDLKVNGYKGTRFTKKSWVSFLRKNHHAFESNTCPSKKGQDGERVVSEKLTSLGIKNKLMPINSKFDILLIDSPIRIEVKTSLIPRHAPSDKHVSDLWRFSLLNKKENFDFLILFIPKTNDFFVIPSERLGSRKALYICSPTLRPEISKWEWAKNNFNQLL